MEASITMDNRIRKIRKKYGLSQEAFGIIINTTQQAVSKMEKNLCAISSDLLIRISQHFNVTTDYILGFPDNEQELGCQVCIEHTPTLDNNFVLLYESLSEENKNTICNMLECMRLAQEEKRLDAEEVTTDVKNSNM